MNIQCPKCGTPARIIVLQKARVRCELNPDGSVGRVVSASRDKGTLVAFECGGGHVWEDEQPNLVPRWARRR